MIFLRPRHGAILPWLLLAATAFAVCPVLRAGSTVALWDDRSYDARTGDPSDQGGTVIQGMVDRRYGLQGTGAAGEKRRKAFLDFQRNLVTMSLHRDAVDAQIRSFYDEAGQTDVNPGLFWTNGRAPVQGTSSAGAGSISFESKGLMDPAMNLIGEKILMPSQEALDEMVAIQEEVDAISPFLKGDALRNRLKQFESRYLQVLQREVQSSGEPFVLMGVQKRGEAKSSLRVDPRTLLERVEELIPEGVRPEEGDRPVSPGLDALPSDRPIVQLPQEALDHLNAIIERLPDPRNEAEETRFLLEDCDGGFHLRGFPPENLSAAAADDGKRFKLYDILANPNDLVSGGGLNLDARPKDKRAVLGEDVPLPPDAEDMGDGPRRGPGPGGPAPGGKGFDPGSARDMRYEDRGW